MPEKEYEHIYCADRNEKTVSPSRIWLKYDLEAMGSNISISTEIHNRYARIDIVFASYLNVGLSSADSPIDIGKGLRGNMAMPLDLFSRLSRENPTTEIRGVFISSMYAHVAPRASNYRDETEMNPLYYGAAKAGVEQGLKWLSCNNRKHCFNAIALGPTPKPEARLKDPELMDALLSQMPAREFIDPEQVSTTINYLLGDLSGSLRGRCIHLDGGYTLW
jgi:NAD(P)-dependent dehydrogenase (short-subunit alcohol dehydrogenase family)